MDWPPYSPDLDPIENLWKRFKDEVMRAHPELLTMKDSDATMNHLLFVCKRLGKLWDKRC